MIILVRKEEKARGLPVTVARTWQVLGKKTRDFQEEPREGVQQGGGQRLWVQVGRPALFLETCFLKLVS